MLLSFDASSVYSLSALSDMGEGRRDSVRLNLDVIPIY